MSASGGERTMVRVIFSLSLTGRGRGEGYFCFLILKGRVLVVSLLKEK